MFIAGLNIPITTISSPSIPSSPNSQSNSSTPTPIPNDSSLPVDEFTNLILNLRKSFITKKSFQIWDNSRGNNCEFHTVLVEKNVRFPPLKARPTSTNQSLPLTLHSPISPLSPSSPLFPDGIMAPIWIRKHREMIPSVFVLILKLSEFKVEGNPLDNNSIKEEEERLGDLEIVSEILDRKRSTIERGIKLVVILMCSKQLLELDNNSNNNSSNQTLDLRLNLIRRQSGLDSKSSLFLISPLPNLNEVENFIQKFKIELFSSALDYYREHGRRIRRKRARQIPKGLSKLSDKGWKVRYDYKMAMFSEMRGEIEVALKHYEDCYETLVEMFANTNLLTPRTKRWAEAKVLADCLTVKISKMYLYLNEPSRAVAQLNKHTNRFRELSNTWGIGEQTFEFWSWLSKQYKLFADLTVIASKAGFKLPSLIPPPTSSINGISPGLVPSQILQHSGYYFYLSALCAIKRKEKFQFVLDGLDPDVPLPPSITHESKINHGEIILDLFTKAYEYFKVNKTSRMTLFIASQIGLIHFNLGHHELALKFHERIARNYRREGYRKILDSILELSFISTQVLGQFELGIKILLELLAPDSNISLENREVYTGKLLEILKNNKPSTPEKGLISIDMSEIAPLFECKINFWNSTSTIATSTPFQLSISSPLSAKTSSISFHSLLIHFNDNRSPILIENNDNDDDNDVNSSGEGGNEIDWIHLGDLGDGKIVKEGVKSKLIWRDGSRKIFDGEISTGSEIDLTISKIVLSIREGDWMIDLEIKPDFISRSKALWYSPTNIPIMLQQLNPSICHIQPRELKVDIKLELNSPAYIDEEFEIHLDILNQDQVEIEAFLDITLLPTNDGSPNRIFVDDLNSTTLLKNISIGNILPGITIRKTFRLLSLGLPGDRNLDLSIRIQPTSSSSTTTSRSSIASSTEHNRNLIIQTIRPLHAYFITKFHKKRKNDKNLLDLIEPTGWENSSDVEIIVKLGLVGPWEIEIVGLKLICDRTPTVRVASSSLDDEDSPLSLRWQIDDIYNVIYKLDVLPAPSILQPTINAGAYLEVTWRRFNHSNTTVISSTLAKTNIPLPALYSIPLLPSITLPLPATMLLHQPTTLSYKFTNPTRKVLNLVTQIDSAEGFVFAGPRKLPILILIPGESRIIKIIVVPLVVGEWRIPRMRVFEIEKNKEDYVHDNEGSGLVGGKEEVRLKEIQVTEETDLSEIKDPKQILLEKELRKARGESENVEEVVAIKEFKTLILPL